MNLVVSAFLIIGGGVALSLMGLILVRRWAALQFLEEHTPIATTIIQIVGTLYAVLIAFSVITTWDHFQDARHVANREANCLNDTFRLTQGLSGPVRDPLRSTLLRYGRAVMGDEWDKMAEGQESQPAIDAYTTIWDLIATISPASDRDRVLYDNIMDRLTDMSDARRERLIFSRGRLGGVIWFTLIAGGALTIGFSWFFTVRQARKQSLMTAILAGMVCLNLFTIAVINRPFSGSARIEPDAMHFVVAHMEGSLNRQPPVIPSVPAP
jgi:hypothetical protein